MSAARPFSLVRRLTLVVAGGIFVTVAALLLGFTTVMGPLFEDRLPTDMRQVEVVRRALAAVPAAQRAAFAGGLREMGLDVTDVAPAALQVLHEPPPVFGPPRMERAIALQAGRLPGLGPGPGPGAPMALRAQFNIDGRPWWVTLVRPPPRLPPLLPALLGLLLIGGIAAAVAIVGVRGYARPMAALARALQARRGGLRPIDEPAVASIEQLEVITAFNALVHTLQTGEVRQRERLAGLSHDLRTPLARLRLRAECTLDADTMAAMEADFDALDRMITQFVAFAHVGSSDQPAGRPVPLETIVQAVVGRYRERGRDTIAVQGMQARPGPVLPDLAMHRVLANLIDNALAHGRPPVELAVERRPSETWILVRDHGPGIAAGELSQAIEPFAKLGSSGARGGSSGLGLAIVDDVARQLGGRIVLESFDGRRSGVGVALPEAA